MRLGDRIQSDQELQSLFRHGIHAGTTSLPCLLLVRARHEVNWHNREALDTEKRGIVAFLFWQIVYHSGWGRSFLSDNMPFQRSSFLQMGYLLITLYLWKALWFLVNQSPGSGAIFELPLILYFTYIWVLWKVSKAKVLYLIRNEPQPSSHRLLEK